MTIEELRVLARRYLDRQGRADIAEALGLLRPDETGPAAHADALRGPRGRSQIQSRARGAR